MDITDEINLIDPNRIKLYRDSFNELTLEVEGEGEYSEVEITRLFPISDPKHYICFKGVKKEDEKTEGNSDSDVGKDIPEAGVETEKKEETSSDHTSRAKQIGIVKDIQKMDSQSRKIAEEELAIMYFIPKITSIQRIKSELGSYKWVVETNKGEREFDVRHREDIRVIESNRIMVRDVDGNRFEIPNYNRLDSRSKSMLERYM